VTDLRSLNSNHIHALMNIVIDNTNQSTRIKMYTFTYNLLRCQHCLIFCSSSSEIVHQTSIYKTQMCWHTHKHIYIYTHICVFDVNSMRMICRISKNVDILVDYMWRCTFEFFCICWCYVLNWFLYVSTN